MYKILYFLLSSVINSLLPCQLFIKHIEKNFYLNAFLAILDLIIELQKSNLSRFDIFNLFHYDRILNFCD